MQILQKKLDKNVVPSDVYNQRRMFLRIQQTIWSEAVTRVLKWSWTRWVKNWKLKSFLELFQLLRRFRTCEKWVYLKMPEVKMSKLTFVSSKSKKKKQGKATQAMICKLNVSFNVNCEMIGCCELKTLLQVKR